MLQLQVVMMCIHVRVYSVGASFKVSRFKVLICHDYIQCIRFIKENTTKCKKGEEAHKETIRAYGAMGLLKLDYEIKFTIYY